MDLKKLEHVMALDVDVVTYNFMSLYLKFVDSNADADVLAGWAADNIGNPHWIDSEHFMSEWLILQAERVIYDMKDDPEITISDKPETE